MDKHIFGEFMGTLVLILMGNGVVANVSAAQIQGRGCRLDGDRHGLGAWR